MSRSWKVDFQNLFKTIPVKKQEKYNLNVQLQDLGININPFNKENLIKINWREGYFQSRGYAGFNYRKSIEGEFVKQLCDENNI